MALVGLSIDATMEFISPRDPACTEVKNEDGTTTTKIDRDAATIFKLGTITRRTLMKIQDKTTAFRQDPGNPDEMLAEFKPNESAYEMVRNGMKGWTNFPDEKGNNLKFLTEEVGGAQVVATSCMNRLDLETIQEISLKLTELNTMKEEEAKNSEE